MFPESSLAQGSALSVEKEWTKALCHGNSAALGTLNAGERFISCWITQDAVKMCSQNGVLSLLSWAQPSSSAN